ncbi:MAG: carbohydrate binding family 9 domain-containing protein [Bacteroidia bacterium]|nr:carbohydrate binding family 9 domain-containing protein [Bacteroidia bacterium]
MGTITSRVLMRSGLCCLLIFFFSNFIFSQSNIEKKIISKFIQIPVKIDGVLNDSIWQYYGTVHSHFYQQYPYDTSLAVFQSSVMVANDMKNLYVAALCKLPNLKKPVVQSLKRDFSFPTNDAFVVTIDPFSDGQNGFSFGLNPYGSQREGLIQTGGAMGVTTIWDNIWYSSCKIHDSIWTIEMKIPFKSLRFKKGRAEWKINFSRNNLHANESSNWFKVPRQFNNSTLAYTGTLIFENPPGKRGENLAFIPYVIGRQYYNYLQPQTSSRMVNAGADFKWTPGNSMNLDLTLNPDFSQVEADRQIINLTRFNIFFPEQRQFFLENSDLFERFGFRQIRPFFSRRIGLENGEFVPIIYGIRLSGKPNQRWRIGLMNTQTLKSSLSDNRILQPENFSVGAFQYNIFARSNMAGIVVHRLTCDTTPKQNSVFGLDYNLASRDNRWMGKLFFHHSLSSDKKNENAFAHASWINYHDLNWNISWNHEYVDKNYRAETGFTPRIFQRDEFGMIRRFTYWRLEPNVYYTFYPKSKIINKVQPGIYLDAYFNEKLLNTDQFVRSFVEITGQKTWSVSFGHQYNYTRLLFQTDVSFTGLMNTIPAGNYYYYQGYLKLNGDQRKDIYPSFQITFGDYFNGKKISQLYEISLRIRPYLNLTTSYNREDISLPQQKNITLHLVNPRLEITPATNLFFTFFWQYNTQNQNINLNARMQWRFRPMSDFYLVWIDNYTHTHVSVKNRAVIAKVVIWLNT